jgi:hypothetical protein
MNSAAAKSAVRISSVSEARRRPKGRPIKI